MPMEARFYLAVAVVVSCFQAYRGYKIGSGGGWPLNGIAEGFFYFVCSALGFVSFVLAYHLLFHGPPMWDLSASTLAFIAFLWVHWRDRHHRPTSDSDSTSENVYS